MLIINKEYAIENDNVCLTLYRSRVVKEGKNKNQEVWDAFAFYNPGRFDQAFGRLVCSSSSGLDELKTIADKYNEIQKDIKDFVEKLKSGEGLSGGSLGKDKELIEDEKKRTLKALYGNDICNSSPKEWRRIATEAIRRDKFTCRRCKTKKLLTVHHINPRAEGGLNELRNLITLCKWCHDYVEINKVDNWHELNRVIEHEDN